MPLRFDTIDLCPVCGYRDAVTLWSGGFLDQPVRTFLDQYGYSADIATELADQRFELVRCRSCEFQYHKRVLDPESMAIFYDQWIDKEQVDKYVAEHCDARQASLDVVRHCLRMSSLFPTLDSSKIRVLDFGCGDGAFLAIVKHFGFEVFGVDRSASRLASCAQAGINAYPSMEEIPGGPFHVITLFQALEHVPRPLDLLIYLRRFLVPHGALIVEVPEAKDVDDLIKREQFMAIHPLEHVNAFTIPTLLATVRRAGYTPTKKPLAVAGRSLAKVARDIVGTLFLARTTNIYCRSQ